MQLSGCCSVLSGCCSVSGCVHCNACDSGGYWWYTFVELRPAPTSSLLSVTYRPNLLAHPGAGAQNQRPTSASSHTPSASYSPHPIRCESRSTTQTIPPQYPLHYRPPLLTIHPLRTGSDRLSDPHGRARHRCNLQPSAPRRDRLRCGYSMQEGGPGPWASSTKPFAASLPSTRALPHAPSTTTHPLSTHPTTTTHAPITGAIPAPPREHAPSEPYLPSVPPA